VENKLLSRSAKYVVYTAITKGYDILKEPLALWQKDASFVAFMEEPQDMPGWEIRPLPQQFTDPCRNAKIPKILPHRYFPDLQYSLWIDGSFLIKSKLSLEYIIKKHLQNHDLALFKNPLCNSIYEQAVYCLKFGVDRPGLIHRQMQRYADEGYRGDNGMVEGGVILRRHTSKVQELNEAWYGEIVNGSRRDQLSFNYVVDKLGMRYGELPGFTHDNPYFLLISHLKEHSKPVTKRSKFKKKLPKMLGCRKVVKSLRVDLRTVKVT